MASFRKFNPGAKMKPYLVALVSAAILLIWVPMMAASLTASTCENGKYDEAKRLRFCNFAIPVSGVTLFATEPHKRASMFLERGILLANKGETEAAYADMKRALNMVTDNNPQPALLSTDKFFKTYKDHPEAANRVSRFEKPDKWLLGLLARSGEPDISADATAIWYRVLAEGVEGN